MHANWWNWEEKNGRWQRNLVCSRKTPKYSLLCVAIVGELEFGMYHNLMGISRRRATKCSAIHSNVSVKKTKKKNEWRIYTWHSFVCVCVIQCVCMVHFHRVCAVLCALLMYPIETIWCQCGCVCARSLHLSIKHSSLHTHFAIQPDSSERNNYSMEWRGGGGGKSDEPTLNSANLAHHSNLFTKRRRLQTLLVNFFNCLARIYRHFDRPTTAATTSLQPPTTRHAQSFTLKREMGNHLTAALSEWERSCRIIWCERLSHGI